MPEEYGFILAPRPNLCFRCALLGRKGFPECSAVLSKRFVSKCDVSAGSIVRVDASDVDSGEGYADILEVLDDRKELRKLRRDGLLPPEDAMPLVPARGGHDHQGKASKTRAESAQQHKPDYDDDDVIARIALAATEAAATTAAAAAANARSCDDEGGEGGEGDDDDDDKCEGEDEQQAGCEERRAPRLTKSEKWARKHEAHEVVTEPRARRMDDRAADLLRNDASSANNLDDL